VTGPAGDVRAPHCTDFRADERVAVVGGDAASQHAYPPHREGQIVPPLAVLQVERYRAAAGTAAAVGPGQPSWLRHFDAVAAGCEAQKGKAAFGIRDDAVALRPASRRGRGLTKG